MEDRRTGKVKIQESAWNTGLRIRLFSGPPVLLVRFRHFQAASEISPPVIEC